MFRNATQGCDFRIVHHDTVELFLVKGEGFFYLFGESVEYSWISYLRKNTSMGNVGSLDL